MSEALSALIFVAFVILLVVAAGSTTVRYLSYRREGVEIPRLLPRDRDVFIGLALPFLLIGAMRAFELQHLILNPETGAPYVWWVLVTGLPPIYAVARYCWFELFVIEK